MATIIKNTKKSSEKKHTKDIKVLPKKKKSVIRIFLRNKKRNWQSIQEIII